jgi:DNA-binding LacI/PurR family transcriptional regulator
MEQQTQRMGQLAVERLHTRCISNVEGIIQHLLPGTLIVRSSCTRH